MLRFDNAVFGSATSGSFSFYFDGSDVGLGGSDARDLNAAHRSSSDLYASIEGTATIAGFTFTPSDIAICRNVMTGANSGCGAGSGLYWRAAQAGLDAGGIDALAIVGLVNEAPVQIDGMDLFLR
jgi:hypothetical protein